MFILNEYTWLHLNLSLHQCVASPEEPPKYASLRQKDFSEIDNGGYELQREFSEPKLEIFFLF